MDTEIKCKFRGSSISRMQQLPQHLGKASRLRMDCVRTKDNRRSIFDAIDESSLREAKQIMGLSPTGDNKVDAPRFHALCSEHGPLFDRQMGCYMGMVLGDYLGAPIEFLPARDSYTSSSLTTSSPPPAITITAAGSVRYPGEISNVFHLQLGQWTDDSAMGACIADSLIVHDEEEEQQNEDRHVTGAAQKEEEEENENENETTFVGWHYSFHARDIRSRFWNWHANGYNNAFKLSTDRSPYQSVGLGGNIAKSLQVLSVAAPDNRPILPPPIATSVNTSTKITTVDGSTGRKYEDIPEFFSTVSQDSGIGGIMRVAPIPVFFAPFPVEQSMKYAALSSQITHPGHLATQAAVFLSFFLHSCMNRSANDNSKPLAFTKAVVQAFMERETNYVSTTDAVNMVNDPVSASFNEGEEAEEEDEEEVRARKVLNRLLRSNEPATSLEVAWNWTEPVLRVERCNRNRGDYYNGYPNNTGYFGSYCMDGLAVALHSFAHSSSFTECMQVCINIRGDSDSTAAVAGQMAGAFYGITSIPPALLEHTMQHDNGENMMRSVMLTAAYREAQQKLLRKKAKQREGETTAEAHTRTTNRPSITHQHDNPRQTTFTKSFPVYTKQPKSQKLPSAAASASPAFAGVSTSQSHPQSVLQRLKTLLNTNQN